MQINSVALNTKQSSTKPVHILYVIDQLMAMGGAEKVLIRIIDHLPREKFQPTVITFRADECQALVMDFPCPLTIIPLERTYNWNAFQAARKIRHYIRRQNVQIVHTFFETSDLWGGLVTKSTGRIALISSRRDMGILRMQKHRFAYRLLNRMFDRVITVSEQVRKYCLEVDRLSPNKVITVYNGTADCSTILENRSLVRTSLGFSDQDRIITTVGNIRKVKGIDILVQAAAQIKNRFPNARFLIVGDVRETEYMYELQKLVAQNQLDQQFRFIGPREDISTILGASDMFVLPSRSEGFSNALIEAMMCRLPCIATNVGGNAEALHDGVSGYLVPNESVERIAKAIALLLDNSVLRDRMGMEGRRIALELFTVEKMVNGLIEVYEAVVRDQKERQ